MRVKVKKVTKARKSFVIKICFNIRWLKDAVEVSNYYGEMVAGLIQCRTEGLGQQAAAKDTVVTRGKVKMDEGHITNLEVLDVAWSQVCCLGNQWFFDQGNEATAYWPPGRFAYEGVIAKSGRQGAQSVWRKGAFLKEDDGRWGG